MTPDFAESTLRLHRCDCMELMATFPDGHFDLAIVDPPYGISAAASAFIGTKKRANTACAPTNYGDKDWDSAAPPAEYFDELRRVSRHQIIWGANHFMDRVMRGSPAWIVWDKENGANGFADAELAFSSFASACRIFRFRWLGMLQGDMANKESRIHPTQKPVALYRWLLDRYAKPGQRILDTHLGSGSIAIACHQAGLELTACEIDEDYFAAAVERIKRELAQPMLPGIVAPKHEEQELPL